MPVYRFFPALTLTLVLFTLNHLSMQLPTVKPATAASNEFSGERAYTILSTLLAEDQPHPTGSPLNKIVKERIIQDLSNNNIQSEIQNAWACSFRFNSCAFVENIIAIIPGRSEAPYVALMSHYDSVPMAPGAGDDGAAVAAMLETARILKSEAPFENPILLIFTDAEEQGLIGAEGFFKNSKYAEDIGILLNFEGSGSTGLVQVLRTSGYNSNFINAFQSESSYPRGASLISEIFKRMPNDTDFSTVKRANISGIDFAFGSERNHYHTPLDNLAQIDIRTLQHHGENMLPLTRWLANNLSEALKTESNVVYTNVYSTWLQWPIALSPYLLILSILLLTIGLVRSGGTLIGTLGGMASAILVILFTIGFGVLTFKVISLAQGTTVAWPANEIGYRLALFASTLTGGLCAAIIINKYISAIHALVGTWYLWGMLSVLLLIEMPDAANLLLAPLFAGSLLIFVTPFMSSKNNPHLNLLSLVILIPATLGLVFPLIESQGYRLIISTLPFIGLFMTVFVPIVLGAQLRLPVILTSSLTIIGISLAIITPLYSQDRPQHININYFEDMDKGTAFYQIDSNNTLPMRLTSILEIKEEKRKLFPLLNKQYINYSATERSGFVKPEITIIKIDQRNNKRVVDLKISSPRSADIFEISTPSTANLIGFALDGILFESKRPKYAGFDGVDVIRISGMYDKNISLKLIFETEETVDAYIADTSTALPISSLNLIKNRPPLGIPAHRGDKAILFRRVTL
ncbi:MAG: hypothetical protein ACI9CE_003474 [Flavobacterium sp.]|jgi:hypothetical protein